MTKLAWSLVRSETKPSLELELRLAIEALWALPLPDKHLNVVLLPSNLLVGSDGSVTLGAAETDESGAFERYLAPELRGGAAWSLLSAIYSLGALLFEGITGQSFESQRSVQVELSRCRTASALGTGSDHWLIPMLEALAKATHDSPGARWQTPEAFSRELARVAADRIATRDELGMLVEQALRTAPTQPPTSGRTMRGISVDLSHYPDPPPLEPEAPAGVDGENSERVQPSPARARRSAVAQRYQGASLAVVISVAVLVAVPVMTRGGSPVRQTPVAQDPRVPAPEPRHVQSASPETSGQTPSSAKARAASTRHARTAYGEPGNIPQAPRSREPSVTFAEHASTEEVSSPPPLPKRQRAPERVETFDYGI